jgi:predicted molibdopterin-dependent oxidoreductase YjgC
MKDARIKKHPILGDADVSCTVRIQVDGVDYEALEGEMIAAALLAHEISTFRYTTKKNRPRGIYCGIGRCTDCVMTVDGIPNVRTCVTPVRDGMVITTQHGFGSWRENEHV